MAAQFIRGYPGGLPALIGAFANAGSGRQAQSWVSTGQNLPITPEQIFQVGGQGRVQSIGQQVGLTPQDALAGLSGHLPALLAQLTPRRHAPSHRRARRLTRSCPAAAPHVGACMGALPLTAVDCR